MPCVLGVDGGNSKTDYLLHDLEGRLLAHVRAGTCSHEHLGLDGTFREMNARVDALVEKAGVPRAEVAAAAFGLAGIDQPVQQAQLLDVVHQMGFSNAVAMNDSFLGIKAGSELGFGVCSVNGTGTAAGGIDPEGRWVQVGGIGDVSGDDAGGSYIARRTLRATYDAAYRFGEPTALLSGVLSLFKIDSKEKLHEAISVSFQQEKHVTAKAIATLLFQAADAGDAVARGIVLHVADSLAASAAGCAVRLCFPGEVPVVLIGSVWAKGRHPLMLEHFKARFERYADKPCGIHILDAPPAAGSVLWALELAGGRVPDKAIRARVLRETEALL